MGECGDIQMPKLKLTQAAVDRLKPPASGRVEVWDLTLPAFGLRVAAPRPGGEARKTWQVMYRVNGKLVRETLGTLAAIPKVESARDLARASMEKAQRGIHPVEERERAEAAARAAAAAEAARQQDTLGAVIDRYLLNYAKKRMRPDYFAETKRTLERDVKASSLGARPIREITRREIREVIEAIVARGAPSHANHVLMYLRVMLNWAMANDLIERNPCDGLKMPAPTVERDRALNDEEVRLFWLGCDKIGWPFGPLFKLLLLTAQRRDEVAEAQWSEFNLEKAVWVLPRHRVKNDKAHVVALSPAAVEILAALPRIRNNGWLLTSTGETPVSGFGRARERLAAAMLDRLKKELVEAGKVTEAAERTIEPFTLHDLRRTAATGMAGLGVAHHVVDRILNHTAGKISGVARIYNRHEYADERKAALDAWAAHIARLVEPPPATTTVVRLIKAWR